MVLTFKDAPYLILYLDMYSFSITCILLNAQWPGSTSRVLYRASKWPTFALKWPKYGLICMPLFLKVFLYVRKNPPRFSTKSITFELLACFQAFNYSFLKLDGRKSLSICFSMLVILLKIHVFFTFMFPHVFVISFLLISF